MGAAHALVGAAGAALEDGAALVDEDATSFTYDANGQPDTVTHPDQYTKYEYDLRELVKTVKVGDSASDATPNVTAFTYTDRGQKLMETKADNNTVDYTYYLNGAIKSQTEKKSNGTLVASHTYSYDANGNRSQDVAKKMNADSTGAYLDSTTDHTYDPVDRIKQVTKTGNGAGTESYVHDNNANVISQNVRGESYGNDDDSEYTGIDKPVATDPTREPYNAYRFNGKRWDVDSQTYDMGFRDYRPDINRFTTRDMYNGALSDMRLGVDAVTGNRYAFTGGNPVSRIEIDGHECWGSSGCYEDKTPTLSDSDRDFLCTYGYMGCPNKSKGIPEEDVPADESPTESVPAVTGYGDHADAAQKTTRQVCNQPIGRGKSVCSTVSPYAWKNNSSNADVHTTGDCYNASFSFLVGLGFEYCSMSSDNGESGSTLSIGPQLGIGGSASRGVVASNVESYTELSGWGVDAEFAGGEVVGGYIDG
ncbi:RHS repeat-associated core domain-containing protein [Streptomyces sp. TRM68367]|uniref:RHS repeat-associated core domain-containing protein n=1 Tax=Streptomyces sp. TRM68367 TaxID=2758415 RepID=UPI0029347075|nr:RHS repeat-associated core domain-containing protein [Streptomyces sp. TRM68367]